MVMGLNTMFRRVPHRGPKDHPLHINVNVIPPGEIFDDVDFFDKFVAREGDIGQPMDVRIEPSEFESRGKTKNRQ